MGGPFLFGAAGWRLVPRHFAERHGLIVIIALGESIVAIGVGAEQASAAASSSPPCWASRWRPAVVGVLRCRRLSRCPSSWPRLDGERQNELARDGYSYLHFPMVAGIVLVAFGMKSVLAHVGEPLDAVPAVALRWRARSSSSPRRVQAAVIVRAFSKHRVVVAVLVCAAIPLATEVSAGVGLAATAAIAAALAAFETTRFGAPPRRDPPVGALRVDSGQELGEYRPRSAQPPRIPRSARCPRTGPTGPTESDRAGASRVPESRTTCAPLVTRIGNVMSPSRSVRSKSRRLPVAKCSLGPHIVSYTAGFMPTCCTMHPAGISPRYT